MQSTTKKIATNKDLINLINTNTQRRTQLNIEIIQHNTRVEHGQNELAKATEEAIALFGTADLNQLKAEHQRRLNENLKQLELSGQALDNVEAQLRQNNQVMGQAK